MPVPSPHNLSFVENMTGIVSLTQGVNTNLLNGYYGVLILGVVFLISAYVFIRETNDPGKAFMFSSFVVFALSVLLRVISLVPDVVVYGSLALLGLFIALVQPRNS